MPVYWGVRWDLNPCHKEPQSSALPDWATNTVLMERLELSTTALWEQPSTIEVHQLLLLKYFLIIVGIQGIEPWLLPYQSSFLTIRRYANVLRRQELNPQLLVLETSVLPIELLPNYLVAGSGFAPLVSPLCMGQDYYFSNLLKHQIIDYFSLLHSENFQKWWHQVLQATWLNSLQKFLRDL